MPMKKKLNHFVLGFLPGLLVPWLFMWAYLARFYPHDISVFQAIAQMYPSILLAKLLMLASIPNFVFTFIFYKSDNFKLATGFLMGGMPYLIVSFFMM